MRVTLWGTRGSLATPGPETVRYGGNTSCVEIQGDCGTRLVLDAGTGIRRLGAHIERTDQSIHILLSHLHMDHIQGLGFFGPLEWEGHPVHIWGPPSATLDLRQRLGRYLSPPLFPVGLKELPCTLELHDVPLDGIEIGGLRINAALVCHPGATLGYRISENGKTFTYLPDHEPVLGGTALPDEDDWISGFELAQGADLLLHDSQYSEHEYASKVGWGHSAVAHAVRFAGRAGVRRYVTFHHDPGHDDTVLDAMLQEARALSPANLEVLPGMEGTSFVV